MKIIIGLGNKGSEYQKTRHNIGEYVVQALVQELGETLSYDKYILSNSVKIDGNLFVVPELYMNESGKVMDNLFKDIKIKDENTVYDNLLVVRDDMDMPIGSVKFVFDSGSGGHNGIKDIEAHLRSKKYWQLKIGILPVNEEGTTDKPVRDDISDFVVGKFSKEEWEKMEEIAKKAVEKVKEFLGKLETLQNKITTKPCGLGDFWNLNSSCMKRNNFEVAIFFTKFEFPVLISCYTLFFQRSH